MAKVSKAVTRGRKVSIPAGSALKPFERKGVEGVCIACRKSIHDHFGHKGVWIGCQAETIPEDTTFILVPDPLSVILPGSENRLPPTPAKVDRRSPKSIMARMATATPPMRVSYVYHARDRRVRPANLTPAWARVYNVLAKMKHPLTVQAIAAKARRPVEATRFTLNAMVQKKLAAREPIEATRRFAIAA